MKRHDGRYIINRGNHTEIIQDGNEAMKIINVLKGHQSKADTRRKIMKLTKTTALCLIAFLILLFIFYPGGW